jgi:hypothetical protein
MWEQTANGTAQDTLMVTCGLNLTDRLYNVVPPNDYLAGPIVDADTDRA